MEEPYELQLYQETKVLGIILLVIVLIFLGVIVILWLFGGITFLRPTPPPAPPLVHPELNWDIGATDGTKTVNYHNALNYTTEDACKKASHTQWSTDLECACAPGFYGPDCNLPTFKDNYYAVGQSTPDTPVQPTIIGQQAMISVIDANKACDALPTCIGFGYDNNTQTATYISQLNVQENGHFHYDVNMPPDYYLRSGTAPQYPDRVFLTRGPLPLRYWLLDRYEQGPSNYISILPNTVYSLNFIPQTIVNNGGHVLYFSDDTFDLSNINLGSIIKVLPGQMMPIFPANWTLPIFVGAVSP